MTDRHDILIEGELHVEIAEVARCYHIQLVEIETWIAEGLLPAPRLHRGRRLVRAQVLDSVATLLRLTRLMGLDVPTIRFLADTGQLPEL